MEKALNIIVDFFTQIGKIITFIVDMVIEYQKALLDFYKNLPSYLQLIESYLNILPSGIKALALLTFAMSIVFVILGRKGQ